MDTENCCKDFCRGGLCLNDKQIEIFLAVSRFANCTQAAQSLYISQSAVSKSIKSLEDELDCLLFDRANGKMTLTEAGRLLLDFSTEFHGKRQKLLSAIRCLGNESVRLPFNIGGIPCTHEYGVMDIIAGFQLNSPQYDVDYYEANQSELFAQLDSKALDIVFARVDFLSPAQYNTFVINDDELVLLCRAGKLPLSGGASVSLAAMEMDCLVTFTHDSSIRTLTEKQFAVSRAKMPYKVIECTRHMQLLSLVANGGCALLPKQLYDTSQMANVKAYRIVDALKTSVGFAWPRAGGGKTKTKAFLSYLTSSGKAIPSGNGISTLE